MPEAPGAPEASMTDQEGFRTRRPRRLGSVVEALLFSARMAAAAGNGVAEAGIHAVRAFGHEREAARVTGKGWVSVIPEGLLSSNAAFFQHLADTCRQMYDAVREWDESGVPRREAPLDYERLARLVAAELRKQQSHGEPPKAP
jgi:hypothetical protein